MSNEIVSLPEYSLEEVADSLRAILKSGFADLSQAPWNLSCGGLGKSQTNTFCDVGGINNMHYPENHRTTTFSFQDVADKIGVNETFFLGAAGGDPACVGKNSELMPNLQLGGRNNSQYSMMEDDSTYQTRPYPYGTFGCLGSLLASDGSRQRVIKFSCATRTNQTVISVFEIAGWSFVLGCHVLTGQEASLIQHIKKGLVEAYPGPVGLAGVFQISSGTIKSHVMPDFNPCPMHYPPEVEAWLKFFQSQAPLLCYSVLLSRPPSHLDDPIHTGWRLDHTHFVSEHGQGGHYHHDTSPDRIAYTGYLTLLGRAAHLYPSEMPPQYRGHAS